MLKIVVFDSGWGGEVVADYLEHELGVVEVVRVIDWATPYAGCAVDEVGRLVESQLLPYIGEAQVIVLGGYVVALALEYLRRRHPKQNFVGVRIQFDRVMLTSAPLLEQVVILANPRMLDTDACAEVQAQLPYSTLIIPDCTDWEDQIDQNLMTGELMRIDLSYDFALAPPIKSTRMEVSIKAKKNTPHTIRGRQEQRLVRAAIQNFTRASSVVAQSERLATEQARRQAAAYASPDVICPDLVILLSTHFWGFRQELEKIFGYKVRVIDFREVLLRDVCAALHLKGVDGKRAK